LHHPRTSNYSESPLLVPLTSPSGVQNHFDRLRMSVSRRIVDVVSRSRTFARTGAHPSPTPAHGLSAHCNPIQDRCGSRRSHCSLTPAVTRESRRNCASAIVASAWRASTLRLLAWRSDPSGVRFCRDAEHIGRSGNDQCIHRQGGCEGCERFWDLYIHDCLPAKVSVIVV